MTALAALLLLDAEELDTLLLAMARSVDPAARPKDATEAAAAVWRSGSASVALRSLATVLAEARYGLE
jgi:hypothetical protein